MLLIEGDVSKYFKKVVNIEGGQGFGGTQGLYYPENSYKLSYSGDFVLGKG